MRTYFLVILAFALVGLFGCKKQADNPDNHDKPGDCFTSEACKLLRKDVSGYLGNYYTTYEYDADNRLKHYQAVDSVRTVDTYLEYDAQCRLVKTTEKGPNGTTVKTINYQSDYILIAADNGAVTKLVYKAGTKQIDYDCSESGDNQHEWIYEGDNVVEKRYGADGLYLSYDAKKAYKLVDLPGENSANNILGYSTKQGHGSGHEDYTYVYNEYGYPVSADVESYTISPVPGPVTKYKSHVTYTCDCK